jgi:hypothetical protein
VHGVIWRSVEAAKISAWQGMEALAVENAVNESVISVTKYGVSARSAENDQLGGEIIGGMKAEIMSKTISNGVTSKEKAGEEGGMAYRHQWRSVAYRRNHGENNQ